MGAGRGGSSKWVGKSWGAQREAEEAVWGRHGAAGPGLVAGSLQRDQPPGPQEVLNQGGSRRFEIGIQGR